MSHRSSKKSKNQDDTQTASRPDTDSQKKDSVQEEHPSSNGSKPSDIYKDVCLGFAKDFIRLDALLNEMGTATEIHATLKPVWESTFAPFAMKNTFISPSLQKFHEASLSYQKVLSELKCDPKAMEHLIRETFQDSLKRSREISKFLLLSLMIDLPLVSGLEETSSRSVKVRFTEPSSSQPTAPASQSPKQTRNEGGENPPKGGQSVPESHANPKSNAAPSQNKPPVKLSLSKKDLLPETNGNAGNTASVYNNSKDFAEKSTPVSNRSVTQRVDMLMMQQAQSQKESAETDTYGGLTGELLGLVYDDFSAEAPENSQL